MSSSFWGSEKVVLDQPCSNGIFQGKWMALTFFATNLMEACLPAQSSGEEVKEVHVPSTVLDV